MGPNTPPHVLDADRPTKTTISTIEAALGATEPLIMPLKVAWKEQLVTTGGAQPPKVLARTNWIDSIRCTLEVVPPITPEQFKQQFLEKWIPDTMDTADASLASPATPTTTTAPTTPARS